MNNKKNYKFLFRPKLLFVASLAISLAFFYSCRKEYTMPGDEITLVKSQDVLSAGKDWWATNSNLKNNKVGEFLDLRSLQPLWANAKYALNSKKKIVAGVPLLINDAEYIELNITIENKTTYGIVKRYFDYSNDVSRLKIYNGNGQLISEGFYNKLSQIFTETKSHVRNSRSPLFDKTMSSSSDGETLEEVVIIGTSTGTGTNPWFPPGPVNPGTGTGTGSGTGTGTGSGVPGDTQELRDYEQIYRQQMTPTELVIYDNMTRSDQVFYLLSAKEASDSAAYHYPGNQHNTKADAFRHAVFQCRNSVKFGQTRAKQLGDAHEDFPGNPALERQMDLFNNEVGRTKSAGLMYPSDATLKIKQACDNGELRYINSNGVLVPSNQ